MTEILLILTMIVMMLVVGGVLSIAVGAQIGRPSAKVTVRGEPWQPMWLAETPREVFVQSVDRQVYYGQITTEEAATLVMADYRARNE